MKTTGAPYLSLIAGAVLALSGTAGAAQTSTTKPGEGASERARGEALYNAACIACHDKDLRGGIGFNLVDGEWVHGSSANEIAASIKNGFPDAGMMSFEGVYSDEEIESIVAFIRSRREGWTTIDYVVWPLDPEGGDDLDLHGPIDATPAKEGSYAVPQADFAIPEMEHYVIRTEGTVILPGDEARAIWIAAGGQANIAVSVDGKAVPAREDLSGTFYAIPAGEHDLSITYTTAGSPGWFSKDLVVLVTDPDTGARLFPLSEGGRRLLETSSYEVLADTRPRVVRRRVTSLPPSTISVGLPGGMNYGFNTRSCAIVGAWTGDFLDIGPNIDGRGQAAAFPLGEWIFHAPDGLAFKDERTDDGTACRYERMSLPADGAPSFHFRAGDVPLRVTGEVTDGDLMLTYRAGNGADVPPVSVPALSDHESQVQRTRDGDGSIVRVSISAEGNS